MLQWGDASREELSTVTIKYLKFCEVSPQGPKNARSHPKKCEESPQKMRGVTSPQKMRGVTPKNARSHPKKCEESPNKKCEESPQKMSVCKLWQGPYRDSLSLGNFLPDIYSYLTLPISFFQKFTLPKLSF